MFGSRSRLIVLTAALGVGAALLTSPTALAAPASRQDIYVSPYGSDRAPGTQWRPVRSLEKARDLARSRTGNRTVHLASGTYRLGAPLQLDARDDGVTWQGSGDTVISGGRQVTGWRPVAGRSNLWSAPAPAGLTDTRQLYVNGVRAERTQGRVPVTLTATATGYTASAATMAGWRNPADLEFVYTGGQSLWNITGGGLGAWTEPRCPVAAVSGTTITMAQPCWNNSMERVSFPNGGRTVNLVGPGTLGNKARPEYVDNAYELLGTPGQWYLDQTAHRIYYTPRRGENLLRADVEAPLLQKLVDAQNIQNVAFRGMQFEYATWLTPSSPEGFSEIQAGYTITGPTGYATQGLCTLIQGGTCPYGNWTQEPGNVDVTGQGVEFSGDVFAHLGAAGLQLGTGTKDSLVKGDVFTDISGNGVEVGGVDQPLAGDAGTTRNVTVADNHLYGLPREFHGGVAIVNGYSQHDTITHNQINDVPYSAISMGWGGWPDKISEPATPNISHDNTVSDNLIYDYMRLLDDGGGIYTQGITGTSLTDGEKVTGNDIHGQWGLGKNVYTDNGCTYETVGGNVLYDAAYANVASRHTDYRDALGNNDPTLITGNYWEQGDKDSNNKGLVTQGNFILADPTAAGPAGVVAAAGLEPGYRGLLQRRVGAAAAPEAPQRVATFASEGTVYATWNPSSYAANGSPIRAYTMTATAGAASKSATISAADFDRRGYAEVAGLTDGTPYTVTVTASNNAGTGAPSLPAPAVTPGPGTGRLPAAPGKPKVNTSADAVSLQWAPPTDSGDGQVIGYQVTVSDGRTIVETGRDVVVTQQSAKTMIRVVGGLKPATAYTLTLAAITGTGTGPAVTTTFSTTS